MRVEHAMSASRLRRIAPLAGLSVFGVALWVLHGELAHFRYHDVMQAIRAIHVSHVVAALALTIVAYGVLPLYDTLALRFIQQPVAARRVGFTAFLSFAIGQTVGLQWLTGGSIRYRLYSSWGLTAVQVATVVAFISLTFGLGALTLGGIVLVLGPAEAEALLHVPTVLVRLGGVLLLSAVVAYVLLGGVRRAPIRLGGWEFSVPKPATGVGQVLVGTLDWTMTGGILYALLSSEITAPFPAFLGLYVLAQVVAIASHVPGGLGVFETVLLVLLKGQAAPPTIVATLVVYRLLYYLIPFIVAILVFAWFELVRQRAMVRGLAVAAGRWVPALTPRMLSLAAFAGGTVLLFSGATPAAGSRIAVIDRVLPLAVVEVSHFVGSLLGLALLVLAWALERRINLAYQLTVGFLGGGIALVLLKGLEVEEALVLLLLLVALLPAREHFYRRASLTTEPFTPGWIFAIGFVVMAVGWLGFFSTKHVAYANDLWWRFAVTEHAPRFLRASVGVLVCGSAFALIRLMRPAIPDPSPPDRAGLLKAQGIVSRSPRTLSNLALVGDKTLLFNETETAFIMYGTSGRSWVALGDPVGPESEFKDLLWRFHELVDRHDGRTVFYQVSVEQLPLYLELGLDPLKLGEEARVPLRGFSLEGRARKGLRHAVHQAEKDGCCFAIVPADQVEPLLPELQSVSDAWLVSKETREKSFSLGRFAPDYLCRFPVGVVRRAGELVAFANIWQSAERAELSVDLMRFGPGAPRGVMDYLFVSLMEWGRTEGYADFNLGMAPLSGLEDRNLAPLWNRLSSMMYRYGEHFYNFQGLRSYKEKFDPEWTARYLVSPGGLALPLILTDIARLVAGGLRGVVTK